MELWEKVKHGLAEGVNTASVRSKEAIDAMKIKGQISSLEGRKADAFDELGRTVYSLYQRSETDEPTVRAKCAAIAELDAEIKLKQEQLAQVHAEAEQALNKPQTVTETAHEAAAAAATLERCECGNELEPGAKFCSKCGRRLSPPVLDSSPPPEDTTKTA